MSFTSIPRITPTISLNRNQVINMLLASVAFEELGLAHIINAEGEKLQSVLGFLSCAHVDTPAFACLLEIYREVRRTLQTVIKSQMLLQFKLEQIMSLEEDRKEPKPPVYIDKGCAWSVGCGYGLENAQYTTLCFCESHKTAAMALGYNQLNIGSVYMLRNGNLLTAELTTNNSYLMNQVQLYVSNNPPVDSNPEHFPHQHIVDEPKDFFVTCKFDVDISPFCWETLYISAHAHVFKVIGK